MDGQAPLPETLGNVERACIPEGKIHYALRYPDKGRVFAALGFSEEAENWEALREAIRQGVSHHAATYLEQNEFGTMYEVVLPIRGPIDKEAPVSLPMWNF
jgi:hypothetical protein